MENKIIILSGFTASGKDTIAKELVKKGLHFITSYTTRPIRPGEKEGDPYFFITKDEFENKLKNKEFLEFRKYNTLVNNKKDIWYYGISKDQVNDKKNNVVVLDVIGLREFKKFYKERCLSFFIYCDKKTRIERIKNRGDYDKFEFERREKDDLNKFSLDVIKNEIDYIIYSKDFDGLNTICYKTKGE